MFQWKLDFLQGQSLLARQAHSHRVTLTLTLTFTAPSVSYVTNEQRIDDRARCSADQSRAEQSKAEQSRAKQSREEQGKEGRKLCRYRPKCATIPSRDWRIVLSFEGTTQTYNYRITRFNPKRRRRPQTGLGTTGRTRGKNENSHEMSVCLGGSLSWRKGGGEGLRNGCFAY